jgi:membrane fusion protein (multidrug efflux system)
MSRSSSSSIRHEYLQSGRTLEFAEANVDQTTGTFTLRAEFPNPDRLLLPGMYVRAILQEGIAENNFLVPQRAVGRNTKGEATAMFVNKPRARSRSAC